MLERGLYLQIQSGIGSPPLTAGGFLVELPKGYIARTNGPAYTYRILFDHPQTTLNSRTGFSRAMVQIDCYAPDEPGVLALAKAVNLAIHGFTGNLPDSDATHVDSCLRSDTMDFPFDPDARNFRRMLEFTIFYANTF